jgi:hypothetical protein
MGRNHPRRYARALGFTHKKTPCASTLHTIFRNINVELLENLLGEWAESILESRATDMEAVAIDGKTLRDALEHDAPIVHLLSAVSHSLGLTLA